MGKGKIKAVLAIIVVILLAAFICSLLTKIDRNKIDNITPADQPAIETPEDPTDVPPVPETPEEAPVAPAEPEPAPEPTPKPTPEPTPEPDPVPVGQVIASGSFSSDTGVAINLRVDWTATAKSSTEAEITMKVSLDSYSIQSKALPGSVTLQCGGQTDYLGSPDINIEANTANNTVFGSRSFTVSLADGSSADVPLSVSWRFGGSYSGVDLAVIECSRSVTLSR